MSAGTGGTTATLGRYIRYKRLATRLCVADPEYSAFFEAFATGNMAATCDRGSRIEGIGRPRVEPSFIPKVIDHMMRVPDEAALAAMRVLSRRLGRRVGGSTGTNFFAPVHAGLAHEGGGREGRAGDADLRQRRALRPHLLQRRLDRRAGLQPRAARAGASTPSWTADGASLEAC